MNDTFNDVVYPALQSFREINRAVKRIFRTSTDELGINTLQLLILEILMQNKDTGITDLAEQLQFGISTVSTAVDQLVTMGLIRRSRGETDRRTVHLSITEEGTRLVRSIFQPDSQLMRRLSPMSELPEEELRIMLKVHQKILSLLTLEED